MKHSKTMHRWWVVVGAVLIQLCLGAIYAWSVFTPALQAAGWSKAQTQVVFAAGLFFFGVVMVFAGRVLPKHGPRKLALAGGLVLGVGYVLGGLAGGTNFYATLLFVGVIGGSGIGLAYVVPIAVGMRWFPDRKGLITGLAVAGFGFGAMLWIKLAGSWGRLIETIGLDATFIVYGVVFLAVVALGSRWMVFPPADWRPPRPAVSARPAGPSTSAGQEFTAREMLHTVQFAVIFITFLFSAGAGLMCIGLMKLFPMTALAAGGFDEVQASAIAGTAMAVFFSLANGLGRIAWGALADRLGRKASVIVMTASQGVLVIAFQWMAGTPSLLYLGAALIGFNFGGNFSLFPTITAEIFGAKAVGQNYPLVFLAYGVGGIFGPILGGRLGDVQNFPLAFTLCGVLCIVAAGIMGTVHPPRHVAGGRAVPA
jgi:OFA family oxalate/formate antiporter-like MFS transporter